MRSQLPDGYRFQDITYDYDNVGNVLQLHNEVALPHGKPVGGPSTQTYGYDDLYRLTSARGEYRYADNKLDRYFLDLSYDTINNTLTKDQRHEIVVNPGTASQSALASTESGEFAGSAAAGPVVTSDPVTEPAPYEELYPPLGVIEEPEEEALTLPPPPEEQAAGTESAAGYAKTAFAGTEASTQENVQPQRKTSYAYDYAYSTGTGARPHAPSAIGPINQGYDANGNLIDTVNTMPPAPGKRRQLVWDEENRLACNQDHNRNQVLPGPELLHQSAATGHGAVLLRRPGHPGGEDRRAAAHLPEPALQRTQRHRVQAHLRRRDPTADQDRQVRHHLREPRLYFHTDHLGSSGYVTDEHSALTEHLEYFAFGETWVNEHPGQPTPVPYQYGGKELDEETGLLYYGARYYNPRTNVWQSPDPILGEYLEGKPNGGVHTPANLALYSYAGNILHAFGDSFAHVDLRSHLPRQVGRGGRVPPNPNCPCMFSAPMGHAGEPDGGHAPGNPDTNPGQYRQYLGGLYDVLSSRAQRENLAPRMTRDQFIETMMTEVSSQRGEQRQTEAAQTIIRRMEAQSP